MTLVLVVSSQSVSSGERFTASVSGAQSNEKITFIYDDQRHVVWADSYGNTPPVTFVGTVTGPVVAYGEVSGSSNVLIVHVTSAFTAQPACYTLNFPPLPWALVHAQFSVTGASPGTRITIHLGSDANGPVLCSALADQYGNVRCSADLNAVQILYTTYTATVPVPGGYETSTASLLPCLP